jgi:hypothetical protein
MDGLLRICTTFQNACVYDVFVSVDISHNISHPSTFDRNSAFTEQQENRDDADYSVTTMAHRALLSAPNERPRSDESQP